MRHFCIITTLILILSALAFSASAQIGEKPAVLIIIISTDLGTQTINRHIYGHFSEHLGHCIYGGYRVGGDVVIPNSSRVSEMMLWRLLKKTQIPNSGRPAVALPMSTLDGRYRTAGKRPKMINTHWGGVTEDNSFGTHEFLDLCEAAGRRACNRGNVGSGSVEEMSKWVEYIILTVSDF